MNIELTSDEALALGASAGYAACMLTNKRGMPPRDRATMTRLRKSAEVVIQTSGLDPTALKDLGIRIVQTVADERAAEAAP